MTNGEKLQSIFPNIIKYGNILIDNTGALQKNILFDDTWWNAEYKEPSSSENPTASIVKNDLAQERYQDLIEYFGGEDTVLKDRKEFKAWLERVKWHVKKADELARELEQLRPTTKDCLAREVENDKRRN